MARDSEQGGMGMRPCRVFPGASFRVRPTHGGAARPLGCVLLQISDALMIFNRTHPRGRPAPPFVARTQKDAPRKTGQGRTADGPYNCQGANWIPYALIHNSAGKQLASNSRHQGPPAGRRPTP